MKFMKVTALIVSFHAALVGLLVLQPGCNHVSQPRHKHHYSFNSNPFGDKDSYEDLVGADEELYTSELETDTHDDFFAASESDAFNHEYVASSDSFSHEVTDRPFRHSPTRPSWGQDEVDAELMEDLSEGLLRPLSKTAPALAKTKRHEVKKGDSLWVIARRNGVSLSKLLDANPGVSRKSVLRIGQKLNIPTKTGIEGQAVPSRGGASYVIARGDTLSEIAQRFKVTVTQIKRANNMSNSNIVAGKKLIIPGVDEQTIASTKKPERTYTAKSSAKTTTSTTTAKTGDYQVRSGESLSVIAARFGITVADLMKWNDISDARKLRAGQWLITHSGTTNSGAHRITDFESLLPSLESDGDSFDDDVFDPFDDDSLFDTSDEIPLVAAGH